MHIRRNAGEPDPCCLWGWHPCACVCPRSVSARACGAKTVLPACPQKCLVEAGWDLDAAYDLLRKKGLAAAAKKASRQAAEGLVGVATAPGVAAVVEINSETDFVARNENFTRLVSQVAAAALQLKPRSAEPQQMEVPVEEVRCARSRARMAYDAGQAHMYADVCVHAHTCTRRYQGWQPAQQAAGSICACRPRIRCARLMQPSPAGSTFPLAVPTWQGSKQCLDKVWLRHSSAVSLSGVSAAAGLRLPRHRRQRAGRGDRGRSTDAGGHQAAPRVPRHLAAR